MPLSWRFMPMLRASHATTTFQQASAGAEDWTACADPVPGVHAAGCRLVKTRSRVALPAGLLTVVEKAMDPPA